jgi:hypothetical protein
MQTPPSKQILLESKEFPPDYPSPIVNSTMKQSISGLGASSPVREDHSDASTGRGHAKAERRHRTAYHNSKLGVHTDFAPENPHAYRRYGRARFNQFYPSVRDQQPARDRPHSPRKPVTYLPTSSSSEYSFRGRNDYLLLEQRISHKTSTVSSVEGSEPPTMFPLAYLDVYEDGLTQEMLDDACRATEAKYEPQGMQPTECAATVRNLPKKKQHAPIKA